MKKKMLVRIVCTAMVIALLIGIVAPMAASAETSYIQLVVDTGQQTVVAYENGKPIRYMLCSTGRSGHSSPTGTFALSEMRERFGKFIASGGYAAYWTQFKGDIYFHSIVFEQEEYIKDPNLRENYEKLGTRASTGCIRLMIEDAQWIYYECPPGTTVTVGSGLLTANDRKKALARVPDYDDYTLPADLNAVPDDPVAVFKKDCVLYDGQGYSKKQVGKGIKSREAAVLQMRGQWCKVRVLKTGLIGYTYTENIELTGEYTPGTAPDMDGSRLPENDLWPYETESSIVITHPKGAQLFERNSCYSTIYDILATGTEVQYLDETPAYYKVDADGVTGYIGKNKSQLFERTMPIQLEEKPVTFRARLTVDTYVCLGGESNFRLGYLPKGTVVNMVRDNLDFEDDTLLAPIWYDGGVAYITPEYVSAIDGRGVLTEEPFGVQPGENEELVEAITPRWSGGAEVKKRPTNASDVVGHMELGEIWPIARETSAYYAVADPELGEVFIRKDNAYKTFIAVEMEEPEPTEPVLPEPTEPVLPEPTEPVLPEPTEPADADPKPVSTDAVTPLPEVSDAPTEA